MPSSTPLSTKNQAYSIIDDMSDYTCPWNGSAGVDLDYLMLTSVEAEYSSSRSNAEQLGFIDKYFE